MNGVKQYPPLMLLKKLLTLLKCLWIIWWVKVSTFHSIKKILNAYRILRSSTMLPKINSTSLLIISYKTIKLKKRTLHKTTKPSVEGFVVNINILVYNYVLWVVSRDEAYNILLSPLCYWCTHKLLSVPHHLHKILQAHLICLF